MTAKPWFEHYDAGVQHTLAPYPEQTLLDLLAENARAHPGHPITLMKGRAMTYAELDRLSDACAAAFAALGVSRGDRIAVGLPNIPQFLIAEFGAWKAGAIVCPFNPTYTERELEDALLATEVEWVVTLNRFYEKVKRVQPLTRVRRVIPTNVKEFLPSVLALAFTLFREKSVGDRITLRDDDIRFSELLRQYRDIAPPAVSVGASDPAVILMSGGTTGTPKGVVGRHGGMTVAGRQLQAWLRPAMNEWTDSIMLPLPLFHTYGNTGVQSLAFLNHNPIVLIPDPRDVGDLLSEIKRTKPAFICAVPTLLSSIMAHPHTRAGKIHFGSIKLCFSGAAPLMTETKRRWEELTRGVVVEGYSLTEAQMAVIANPVLGEKKAGSIGMPLPDVDVRIVDAENGERELDIGQVGEIVISAPQLMEGYWHRDDETRQILRSGPNGERVLFTGDLGYIDHDGYVFLVDRKKDLVKTSGFQVWPREVEEAITSHAAVAECGVAGLPDASRGEILKAWVVLRPGATATAEELKAFCRERLAPYKVPSRWEFVADLPKSTIGKVLRRKLREREIESASAAAAIAS